MSNWGRFGAGDELGTLNYITDEIRLAAARRVIEGRAISLALPIDENGPMVSPDAARAGRGNPVRTMLSTGHEDPPSVELGAGAGFADDQVWMPLQSSTHWDALAHVHYGGQLYGGTASSAVDGLGARRGGIEKGHDRFVSRGVLLDLPRVLGLAMLPPGYAVKAGDLEAAERAHGVRAAEGDVLILRTGLMADRDRTGRWDAFLRPQPGLHHETVLWLHERRVAAVAADNSRIEASDLIGGLRVPFHMLAIRDMGLHLGELWYLEELAAACAADGRYDFMLVAPPLPFTGGLGSPVNPLAIR